MKSIRTSLILYFVVLLTIALGAVSWSSYHMTEQSLRDRQDESRARITSQCDVNCNDVRADLDRRLLEQANAMANLSRSMWVHAEGHLAAISIVGSLAMPRVDLNTRLFAFQAGNDYMQNQIFLKQPISTHVADADWFVADGDGVHGQEYFQLYRRNGYPSQRSASLGEQTFTLDPALRKSLTVHAERFDDALLDNGVKVRRVTMKVAINSAGTLTLRWPEEMGKPNYFKFYPPTYQRPPGFGQPFAGKRKGGVGGFGKPQASRPGAFVSQPPKHFFFIQYAGDLAPTESRIASFRIYRDEQLANLDHTIESELQQLRARFFWICLITIGAVWVGGYAVIRLGLAPLSKMSDAVSKVSAKNFHLALDAKKLPDELQPIAQRLEGSLHQLQKAFTREKQAAADISHELRTPLAALMTTLEVALRKARSAEEYREILEECRGSGQHMYHLVERLLLLARLDAGADAHRPTDADIVEIASQCADLIRPLARARGIDLRLHLPDALAAIADRDKLHEVLVNLLHNAVEYNNPNGSIDLTIERLNGHVRFEVRDTGIGIKAELLEHIFERFYRADPSRHADTPHAGLGLAIVKSYVDLMGGTIQVESGEGGTAFIMELPFVAPRPEPATAIQAELELAHR